MKKHLSILLIPGFIAFASLSYSQTYNHYFGTLHSHSGYSDGNKDSASSMLSTPLEDYNYTKQSLQMDFLGISEHNHSGAGMILSNYKKGIQQAILANEDGSFVCLFGMEWGQIATGGHVLIYGIDSLIGWESNNYDIYNSISDYTGLFQKIANHPGAFITLAHPQDGDYNDLINSTFNPVADQVIVGTPFRSGPAFSTDTFYSDNSNSDYLSKFYDLLKNGYHPAILIDHDTHNTVFGRSQTARTVVMAESLTKENILNALRERRFYASDDYNARVNFTVNNKPIGKVFTWINDPQISLSIADPDAENISSITIYSGKPDGVSNPAAIKTVTNASSVSYTHPISNLESRYYYARVIQSDGDVIYTSPIWYTRDDSFDVSMFIEDPAVHNLNLNFIPNPAHDTFTFSFNSSKKLNYKVSIFNISGALIRSQDLGVIQGSYADRINISDLAPGIYLFQLQSGDKVVTKKFVVE